MYNKIPGTKDILPDEVSWWQNIEQLSRSVFSIFNFKEIRPPIIEDISLFNRTLGEFTEIVQKQMFVIHNQEDTYALRPEGTASVVRAYLENNLDKKNGFMKLFYIGPMFRLERPQKGRLRQFHHVGCEAIGSFSSEIDVEMIALAEALLKSYGISGYKIILNSLGCLKDKARLVDILSKELKDKITELCEECNNRYGKNVLRILDCKNESCRKVVKKLELGEKHLCEHCLRHFKEVRSGLDTLKIPYEVSAHLVRGLDYYTRTVFEITHPSLGAQDALGAGGRYDNLVSELGGPDMGAMGFAFGMERLFIADEGKAKAQDEKLVYFVYLGPEAKKTAFKLMSESRAQGIKADANFENRSLKSAMRRANDINAALVIIIGEDELKKGTVTLKNMGDGKQEEIALDSCIQEIKSRL